MLVLTRKKNERIIIDGNIVITIVEIRGDKARIGIKAPYEVEIHREEVHEQIYGPFKRSESNGDQDEIEGEETETEASEDRGAGAA